MAKLPNEIFEHFNEILRENKQLKEEKERIIHLDNKLIQMHKDEALKYKNALKEIYNISTFDHDVRFPKEKGYYECIRIATKALEQPDNGGIDAPTTSTKKCCECGEDVDVSKTYGVNEPHFQRVLITLLKQLKRKERGTHLTC